MNSKKLMRDKRPLWKRALAASEAAEKREQLTASRARGRDRMMRAREHAPKPTTPADPMTRPSRLAPWMNDRSLLPKRPPTKRETP